MKEYGIIFLKGLAMWACDVVPWVSWGTIAFVTGIYQRLITAIARFDMTTLKLVTQGNIAQAWTRVDGTFLLALFAGIGTSIIALSSVITWALEAHTAIVYSFFVGLILASVVLIYRKVTVWNMVIIWFWLLWLLVGGLITQISPWSIVEPTWWMIIIAAMIAICAMILPGISGSFILLLMGMYAPTIAAIHDRNIWYVAVFAWWAIVGLMSFVRVVRRAFDHYHNHTISFLMGLMIGSLPLLFPWSVVWSTSWSMIVTRFIAAVLGFVIVYGIEYYGNQQK